MDYAHPALADTLAAEYVAGTLRGGARRRFETLLPGHPSLRAAVAHWQALLMPLTSAVQPTAPPARAWAGIEARLWPNSSPSSSPSSSTSSASANSAVEPWWRGLVFWRAASGLATVAAVSFGLLLANPQPQPAPILIVLQATEAGATPGVVSSSFVASVSSDGQSLVTRPILPVTLAPGKALELWAVPPNGAPRSLGLISANGSTVLKRDRLALALLDASRTAALAVSVEPPGGSPTGAPTGPVVFAGKLQL